jgi:hypothetical protein
MDDRSNMTFGRFVKEHRLKIDQTLREFCEAHDYDPGNHSRLERGVTTPPQDQEKLDALARALRLKQGSEEWNEFHTLAAVENGQIPRQVTEDKELLRRLPVLFRTIGSKPMSGEKLDKLIEMIKRS